MISLVFPTGLPLLDTSRVAQLEKKIARSQPPAHTPCAPVFALPQGPRASHAPPAADFTPVSSLPPAEEIALESALEHWIGCMADLTTWIDQQPEVRNPE